MSNRKKQKLFHVYSQNNEEKKICDDNDDDDENDEIDTHIKFTLCELPDELEKPSNSDQENQSEISTDVMITEIKNITKNIIISNHHYMRNVTGIITPVREDSGGTNCFIY